MKSISSEQLDLAREIDQEDDRALEDAEQQQPLAGVLLGDLGAKLGDALRELLRGDQDLGHVVVRTPRAGLVTHSASSEIVSKNRVSAPRSTVTPPPSSALGGPPSAPTASARSTASKPISLWPSDSADQSYDPALDRAWLPPPVRETRVLIVDHRNRPGARPSARSRLRPATRPRHVGRSPCRASAWSIDGL